MYPDVNIILANGQLGKTIQTQDGVVGMVLTAPSGFSLIGQPQLFYNLKAAETAGITASAAPYVHKHIAEFYKEAGDGAKLYIMLYEETVTMEEVLDTTGTYTAEPLLQFAKGEITLLGVGRKPTSETSVTGNFLRADVMDAIAVSGPMFTKYRNVEKSPFRCVLEGRLDNAAAVPQNLHAQTNNNIAVVVGDTASGKFAALGLVLGRMARIPVQRNCGRVKDGPLPITDAYINTTKADVYTGIIDLIEKGYIVLRSYKGRSGYYFSDDPTCVAETDDYPNITYGRVIDKAYRIAYQIYLNELNEEVPVDENGKINAGFAKHFEAIIETQINEAMSGEISSFKAWCDPDQNVIATNIIRVACKITPVGYAKEISIELGFENPFNNN